MRNFIRWKSYFILITAGMISVALVLPYTLALSPALARIFTPAVYVAQFIQSFVLFSISIISGLHLAKRIGFPLPVLEGHNRVGYLKSVLGIAVGLGISAGVLIVLLSLSFSALSLTMLKSEMAAGPGKGFLASFYGGIGEEILFRLFLMTLFVWISAKIVRKPDGHPTDGGIWISIIVSSILFGLGHLGITSDLTAITPVVILRAILLNGVAGVICGWLYWKKGLESAMIAHFSADIVLHVITPFVASLFIRI